jgi:hypothetical protein
MKKHITFFSDIEVLRFASWFTKGFLRFFILKAKHKCLVAWAIGWWRRWYDGPMRWCQEMFKVGEHKAQFISKMNNEVSVVITTSTIKAMWFKWVNNGMTHYWLWWWRCRRCW